MTPDKNAEPVDGEFGIDLGPGHESDEPRDASDAVPVRARQPARTLAQRLAEAAADRDGTDPPTSQPE